MASSIPADTSINQPFSMKPSPTFTLKTIGLSDSEQPYSNSCYINSKDANDIITSIGKSFHPTIDILASITNNHNTFTSIFHLFVSDTIPVGRIGIGLLQRLSSQIKMGELVTISPYTPNPFNHITSITFNAQLLNIHPASSTITSDIIANHIRDNYIGQFFHLQSIFPIKIDNCTFKVSVLDIQTPCNGIHHTTSSILNQYSKIIIT
jgi:hypothetical protein